MGTSGPWNCSEQRQVFDLSYQLTNSRITVSLRYARSKITDAR